MSANLTDPPHAPAEAARACLPVWEVFSRAVACNQTLLPRATDTWRNGHTHTREIKITLEDEHTIEQLCTHMYITGFFNYVQRKGRPEEVCVCVRRGMYESSSVVFEKVQGY